MKDCIYCGEKIPDGLRFCTECGTKQPAPAKPDVNQQTHPVPPTVEKPPKKPMSKRTKTLIGIAAGICVALFGTHQFLSSHFDPMKQLQSMDKAVSEQNMDEFLNHISFDKSATLDKEGYFEYILKDEWDYVRADYLDFVEEQRENPTGMTEKLYNLNGNTLFTIKQSPKLLGLYTTYSLEAAPAKLHISAPIDNTELEIGDLTQTLKKSDTTEVAKIYPGSYDLLGKAENLFGEFVYEDTLTIGASEEYNLEVDFGGKAITLSDIEYPDAALFLDGKDSGKKLGDFEYLGPFPKDSDMEVHAEWKNTEGKVMKSEPFKPHELGTWYGSLFSFDDIVAEEEEEQDGEPEKDNDEEETKTASSSQIDHDAAGDAVLGFRDAYEGAVNTKDFSLIESYLEKGSDADKELSKYIDELENKAYHHDFTSNKILHVDEVDDHTVKVKTNEQFTFTNHLDEQTEYDRDKFYTLTISGDSYKITKIDYVETNKEKQ